MHPGVAVGRGEDYNPGMARYWLTPDLAKTLLDAIAAGRAEFDCSLDLGLTTRRVGITPDAVALAEDAAISREQLREVGSAKRGVFIAEAGRIEPVEIAADYFYKLIPTDEAPTVEISGIQMHRTTGTAPFRNATESAKTVVRKGAVVLDTCGGLGYTAIAAARLRAGWVVSLDIDPNVREIARRNPWSAKYFGGPVIELIDADAAEFVAAQPDASFDCVIHDPPRFSRAGELYGSAFYCELARVLRPRGRLFHYTGEPYAKSRGRSFVDGVLRRLSDTGFETKRAERLQGVVARRR